MGKGAGAGHGAACRGARAALGPLPQERELCPGSWPRGRAQPKPVLQPWWEPAAAPQPRVPPAQGVPQALAEPAHPGDSLGHWKGTNEMNEWGSAEGRLCPRAKVLPAGRTGQGVRDRGASSRSVGEGTGEWILEGSEQPPRDTGLGEPGTTAAGAREKQSFSSRLSPRKLQNKGKLCKASCRRTLVPNRHVVCAAKAPAQGEHDPISFPSFPSAARAAKARSARAARAPVPPPRGGRRGLPTTSPAPR